MIQCIDSLIPDSSLCGKTIKYHKMPPFVFKYFSHILTFQSGAANLSLLFLLFLSALFPSSIFSYIYIVRYAISGSAVISFLHNSPFASGCLAEEMHIWKARRKSGLSRYVSFPSLPRCLSSTETTLFFHFLLPRLTLYMSCRHFPSSPFFSTSLPEITQTIQSLPKVPL